MYLQSAFTTNSEPIVKINRIIIPLVIEQGFLALGCICTLYLKYISYIFEHIKIFQIKCCVYISPLRAH
jgi:hypothetical protein